MTHKNLETKIYKSIINTSPVFFEFTYYLNKNANEVLWVDNSDYEKAQRVKTTYSDVYEAVPKHMFWDGFRSFNEKHE